MGPTYRYHRQFLQLLQKHGRHRYRFSDTGLDEGVLRDRTADHVDFFEVPLQELD